MYIAPGWGHMSPLIYQAVSEKTFECYRDIHVYCPGVGEHEPLGSIFFQNH